MPKAKDLRIEYESIDLLTHLDGNPKTHDIDKIIASIKRFGFRDPVEVDDKTGTITSGHGRVTALARMRLNGSKPPKFIRVVDGTNWCVPVVRGGSFEDKKERDAYVIATNKTVEAGGWNDDALESMMAQFDSSDLDSLGFSEDEWSELVDDEGEAVPAHSSDNPDDDRMPKRPKAITKLGDRITIGGHELLCGDAVELLRTLPPNSVDAIITDPPYGLGLVNNLQSWRAQDKQQDRKEWDCKIPGDAWARECLRVLKPGGRMISFGGTRTIHRITATLEDAGFDVLDMIGWLTWQGFPKSLDVSKAIDDSKGAKRKIIGHKRAGMGSGKTFGLLQGEGVGGGSDTVPITEPKTKAAKKWAGWGTSLKPSQEPAVMVRKPLEGTYAENVLKHGVGGINVDACRFNAGDPAWPGPQGDKGDWSHCAVGHAGKIGPDGLGAERHAPDNDIGRWPANIYYCPKPAQAERNKGTKDGNFHVTVKPVGLMRWLIRLVTPPGGTLVDMFLGSGTTMIAAEREGAKCIGIERDRHYCDIARARVGAILKG